MNTLTGSFLAAANRQPTLRKPGDSTQTAAKVPLSHPVVESAPPAKRKAPGLAKPRGRKGMNKTEAAYALILEARRRAGEITRFEREGITLRWPDGMTYTPDFAIWTMHEGAARFVLSFIETKGAFIECDALVKFRAARAHWPEFDFELHQMKKGHWSQLL